ncbi:hypothetical protein GN958_ATG01340 [Phytophthora infestans]|uniref:Uncharacterized protein n=1 Tax=Phytophthora infestans TaxID=4787 RepID=A0A8S9VDN3_PHYIN|nr:hypothetical protein GN958_ATG01340 [Phytophthora infestans]
MLIVPTPKQRRDRKLAKQRVARVFREGGDWKLAAIHKDVSYHTARHVVLDGASPPKPRGGGGRPSIRRENDG